MTHKGLPNWPPAWTWVSGDGNKQPKGEVGVLQELTPSAVGIGDRCFLIIEYQGSAYMGCLVFDDRSFCSRIFNLLQRNLRREIAYISGLDLDPLA